MLRPYQPPAGAERNPPGPSARRRRLPGARLRHRPRPVQGVPAALPHLRVSGPRGTSRQSATLRCRARSPAPWPSSPPTRPHPAPPSRPADTTARSAAWCATACTSASASSAASSRRWRSLTERSAPAGARCWPGGFACIPLPGAAEESRAAKLEWAGQGRSRAQQRGIGPTTLGGGRSGAGTERRQGGLTSAGSTVH